MSHEGHKTNQNYIQNKRDTDRPFIKAKRGSRNIRSHSPPASTEGSHPIKRCFSSPVADQPPSKKSNTSQLKAVHTSPRKVSSPPNSFASSTSTPVKNLAANRLQKLRAKLSAKVSQESKIINSTKCRDKLPNPLHSTPNIKSETRPKFIQYKKIDLPNINISPDRFQNVPKNIVKEPSTSSTAVTSFRETSCISPATLDDTKISNINFVNKYYSSSLTLHQDPPLKLNDGTGTTNFAKVAFASPLTAQNSSVGTRNTINFDNKRPTYINYLKTPENTDQMEWSSIDDETIVKNVHEIRKDFDYKRKTVVVDVFHCEPNTYNNFLNIVVDTNIFLSNLSFLTTIINTKFPGFDKAIIVIPWMVIQELDYMKVSNGRDSLKRSARKAVQFINDQLKVNHPQFIGQTVMEASKELISSNNPDDGILLCCVQLTKLGKSTVLLSNDMNLRNKAMMNNIRAFANNDLITELSKSPIETNVQNESSELRSLQKIRIILSIVLTEIIEHEMNAAYGDIWQLMTKYIPPLTVDESLNIIGKYWTSVFLFHLQKQCKQTVDDFSNFLKQHAHCDLVPINDYNKFIEYSLSLCIYLKNGYPDYKLKVADCILNIQKAV